MALYQILSWLADQPHFLLRTTDNAVIPQDPGNRDYQDYLVWAAAPGNVADPIATRPALAPDNPAA